MKKQTSFPRIKTELTRILALAVLVLSVCCALIYAFVQRILVTNENEYLLVSSQRLQNRLNSMYDHLENLAVTLSADGQIQELLVAELPEKTSFIRHMESTIAQFQILESDIVDVALVSENMHYSSVYHDEELDEICSRIEGSDFQWVETRRSSFVSLREKEPMFLYGNHILLDGTKVGTLIISVKSSYFTGDLDSIPFSYGLAKDGQIYALSQNEEDAEIWEQWDAVWRETELARFGNAYIQSVFLDKMNCYLVSAHPANHNYTSSNMRLLQIFIWSCILVVALFLFLILALVNKRLVKPLQVFYDSIKEIRSRKKRHLENRLELDGCLEIREIGNEFSDMMEGIDELNKTIFENTTHLYEVELERQKAELAYLRGQVDPHFLYNTLEVMRKQALEKGAPELAQMAVDMGKIFRYSSKGEPFVSLREEVEILQSYVRIQENRFQGRLKVFYLVPEELLDQKVMKMLLQPLVENAIYHGIEPKTGKGAIFLGVRREENCLLLTVKDNGVGIGPEKLAGLKRELEAETFDTSRHVGILNTQARIRLTCGKNYGLTIESAQPGGTSVEVRVPVIEEGGKAYVPGTDCG
ncbi:MAG: sensor histidine kinase [Eubacteriales bacterium]|nr:sensor histidine kinase [Eubacteriales bacterium]